MKLFNHMKFNYEKFFQCYFNSFNKLTLDVDNSKLSEQLILF